MLRPRPGSARARLGAGVGRVRGVHHDRQAKDGALLSGSPAWTPPAAGRAMLDEGRARQGDRAGGERRRRAVPRHLHPGDRLLPAGRHGARRVPAGDHHRRRRPGEIRQVGVPRSAHAFVPPPPDLPGPRAVHDGGRGAVAAARRSSSSFPSSPSASCGSTESRASRRTRRSSTARPTRSADSSRTPATPRCFTSWRPAGACRRESCRPLPRWSSPSA